MSSWQMTHNQICEYVGNYFPPRFWNAPQKNNNGKIYCNFDKQCLQSCLWVAIGRSQKGFTCQNHLPLAFWDSKWDGEVIFILKLGAKKRGNNLERNVFFRRNRIPKRYSTPGCGLDICQIQSDCNIKQSFISNQIITSSQKVSEV